MKTITVFTPAYNRGYILPALYESLKRQTVKDFEWLIVDDGSTDNTHEVVEAFMAEGLLPIRYGYQENAGKHIAINHGVRESAGELFFVVDSDDYLTDDAIERILHAWGTVADKDGFAGLCFRSKNISTENVFGQPFPHPEFDADLLTLMYTYGVKDEKALIYRTAVLGRFPFPQVEGETFVPEGLVWNRIAHSGLKLHCVDYPIYCAEYLPDGYTKNFRQNLKRNHKGFAMYYAELLRYRQPSLCDRLKALVRLLQCHYFSLLAIRR